MLKKIFTLTSTLIFISMFLMFACSKSPEFPYVETEMSIKETGVETEDISLNKVEFDCVGEWFLTYMEDESGIFASDGNFHMIRCYFAEDGEGELVYRETATPIKWIFENGALVIDYLDDTLLFEPSDDSLVMDGGNFIWVFERNKVCTYLDRPQDETKLYDTIEFGGHVWRVLDRQGDQALVISESIIDCRRYDETEGNPVTWETCTVRSYLNGSFYDETFTSEEKALIIETKNVNKNNQVFDTLGGNTTNDKVFLLSLEELVQYFGDSEQLNTGNPDMYVFHDRFDKGRIARDYSNTRLKWWLRSPGGDVDFAACVDVDGWVGVSGKAVHEDGIGIRPALWLKTML